MKRKIVFVYNPISGSRRLIPVLPIIERYVNRDLYDFSIVHTKQRGDATVIAKEYAALGYDAVIAVGGDGTVNEVGCGLIGTETALGILPCGSGNGLARHLGISMDPFKAVKWLDKSTFTHIDYGTIDGHPFFCTCGVGFDATVSEAFANAGSRGLLTYIESILKEIATYKDKQYKLTLDDSNENYESFIVTCANAGQWGNNAYIAPTASLQDGLLDVVVLHPFSVIDAPLMALQLFNKQLDKNRNVTIHKCNSLTIRRETSGPAHYDGDPVHLGKEINIGIVPKGLKVFIPQKHHLI